MRRLAIIPGLLFGMMFAGGGFFVLSQTAMPMWQTWMQMQDWRPASAQLQSVSGADNETLARYRYEYGGATYTGERVGVAEFNDNIGSYHRDMQAFLGRLRGSGQALPIWVNPQNPAVAVIDRNMRWGLFALLSAFCSVFVLIGLLVVVASLRASTAAAKKSRPSLWDLRRRWQQARQRDETGLGFVEYCEQQHGDASPSGDPVPADADWQGREGWEDARIASDAGKGALFFWGFAIFWNAISSPVIFFLPEELARGNTPALIALLFPAVGLLLLFLAVKRTLEYRRFGRVQFHMDPYPGAIGGNVGGHLQVKKLDYDRAVGADSLTVTLECVYSYVSGSGKNRSRRETIKWAERGRPKIARAIEGVNLLFRFDIPEGLPQSDVEQKGAYHFWRLGVSAEVPGVDLNRQYNIPVFATAESSRGVGHDISAQVAAERKREADAAGLAIASGKLDIDGLSRAMRFRQQGDRLRLKFPMFRNRALTGFAAIFAGGFGFACYSMLGTINEGGLFGGFMAVFSIPFFLVAVVATLATVYLALNNLSTEIRPGGLAMRRRLLVFPMIRRRLRREQISRLGIKRTGSTGQGVNKIEHFKIYAEEAQGRKTTIAEDIDGEDVAAHFRDFLAQRIGVSTR